MLRGISTEELLIILPLPFLQSTLSRVFVYETLLLPNILNIHVGWVSVSGGWMRAQLSVKIVITIITTIIIIIVIIIIIIIIIITIKITIIIIKEIMIKMK
jgi:hypothetical protein